MKTFNEKLDEVLDYLAGAIYAMNHGRDADGRPTTKYYVPPAVQIEVCDEVE